ncbi:MAG: HAD hydrolase-like protein [bacterium]
MKHLIFDFDGVLGDSKQAIAETHIEVGDVSNMQGAELMMEQYFTSKAPLAKEKSNPLALAKKLEWFSRFSPILLRKGIPFFDGFISEIASISAPVRLSVVTSGSHIFIDSFVRQIPLSFDHVLCFEDSPSKESKIGTICQNWHVSEKDVYYFTDTNADVHELEHQLTRTKLAGCAWGYVGAKWLEKVLPTDQILYKFSDLHQYLATH